MQDIVPKKSIREITKPHIPGNILPRDIPQKTTETQKTSQQYTSQVNSYPHTKTDLYQREKKYGWKLSAFIVLVLLSTTLFLHFQRSATVYIVSKQETLSFKDNQILVPIIKTQTLSISTSTTIEIKTTPGTPELTKAKGLVNIYNANSTEQVLVAGTRLETSDKKIYRLTEKVVVPKMKNSTTPGSIQVSVVADKTGESYNVTQADFTFPGLAGSARYKTVYARTNGPITGGSEVPLRVVDEKDKNQKITTFLSENEAFLEEKLRTQKTATSTIVQEPDTKSSFEKISDTQGVVTLTSSMRVLDANEFATLLAQDQKENISTAIELVQDETNVKVTYISEDKDFIRIAVQGKASLRARIDVDVIKNKLAGTSMKDFREQMKNISGIEEAQFTSKPFWLNTFPDASRISVEQK